MLDRAKVDSALNWQANVLYRAMGIVRMASNVVQAEGGRSESLADAWTALDGAYSIMESIIKRFENTDALLAAEAQSVVVPSAA
jgi:hypothetical protein